MVINVFKAMQYPREDDAENCMRIDAIDMLIKEIQEEDATLQEKPTMELKLPPSTLKYAFLGKEENLPVIISSSLNIKEEEELLMVRREHKTALRKKCQANDRKRALGLVTCKMSF
ncbi:hypothetical protein PIB30_085370 [Stylosanthes scabra]|uniref:Uncharacterized protein n=1 Tax=Stylosanthes scabra TaxID=79078 RepID=A0ABU6ZRF6_9FABA|nr:hypothetical protein [Stylosanthes scabra]